MELDADDRGRLRSVVERLRRDTDATSIPVDVAAVYRHRGLSRPRPLYAGFDGFLLQYKTPQSLEEQLAWRDGLRGAIDPVSSRIYIDESLPLPRRRFVEAHEFMHLHLDHCDVALGKDRLDPGLRHQMELEASFCAIELLIPAKTFVDDVERAFYRQAHATLSGLRRLADQYQVTPYTVFRRFVETARGALAFASLGLPHNYRGSRSPRDVWLRGFESEAWRTLGFPTIPRREPLVVGNDALARHAQHAIASRDAAEVEAVKHLIEQRFQADADIALMGDSIHALIFARRRVTA